MSREREIADLRSQTRQQAAWQRNVDHAARNAVAVQQRQTLIAELDRMINPPPPASELEPQVVYVSESEDQWGTRQLGPDFNPEKRRW